MYRECDDRIAATALAWSQQGANLRRLGRLADAVACYQRAIALTPRHADAFFNLGNALVECGRAEEAIAAYRRAVELAPERVDVRNNLANALLVLHRWEEAGAEYDVATRLKPEFAEAHFNWGTTLSLQGRLEEARGRFRQAARLRPEKWWWRLREVLLWPPVFQSPQEIGELRGRLDAEVDRISAAGEHLAPVSGHYGELLGSGCFPPYGLAYQGVNSARLKAKFAALFVPRFAADNARWQERKRTPSADGRVRLGVVVTRRHEQIFGRCCAPIVNRLPPEQFTTIVFCSSPGLATLRGQMPDPRIDPRPLPERLSLAAETIRATERDVVLYWEVGSDPFNYFLPFLRTAPGQCTTWGAQITTGVPNIDRFLSCRSMEPGNYESHYTEQVVLGDSLLMWQESSADRSEAARREPSGTSRNRAACAAPLLSRSESRLSDRHIYLCPQNMLKFHPEFDELLAEILRNDGNGIVACLERPSPAVASLVRQRWQRTMPDVVDRVLFLPPPDVYSQLLVQADVILDPAHYSAGSSAHDIFSVAQPIVTLPGELAVGRYTAGCYRRMGLDDLVPASAAEYVALALQLGTNAEFRRVVRERIVESSGALQDEAAVVSDHARFLAATPTVRIEGRTR